MRNKHLYRSFVKKFGKRQTGYILRIQHKYGTTNKQFFRLQNATDCALKTIKLAGAAITKLADAIVSVGKEIGGLGFEFYKGGYVNRPADDVSLEMMQNVHGYQWSDGSYIPRGIVKKMNNEIIKEINANEY